ncbi:hypothetical protein AAG570_002284 [Ranatra chinensis]|uniref:Kazal-like domain-containing protein n=1 Tax=Ranatra chinensis TaxID=642074 RepID=A0ABD0Y7H3_9HEMI
MASKRRNMFHKNKTQETTENDTARLREEKRELEEESRGEGGTVHQSGGVGGGGLRHLPKALLALFSNPTFILVCMAGCCEGALMSGIAAFLPKILENQFGLSPKYAASFLGSVILPSALAGTVFGGWTVNFCKLDLAGILNMCLICMTCAMICVPGLFIVCPTQPLVGITAPYLENENRVGEKEWRSLWSDCNKDCKCDVSRYMPVCGIDKHLYYSACFAGCTRETTESLTNCKCVGGTEEAVETWRSADCTVPCPLFPLFIVLIFCYQFFTFSVIVPGTAAVLSLVGLGKGGGGKLLQDGSFEVHFAAC